MLITPIRNDITISKTQNNRTNSKEISSQKAVTTLPAFADAKSLVNMSFKARIHDCAESGNWDGIQEELDKGVSINMLSWLGITPLLKASSMGNTDIVEKLLQYPDINVNIQDHFGNTPLIIASFHKRTDLVRKILEHPDVNINLKDCEGRTALYYAIDPEIAKMIEDYVPGVDRRGESNQTQDVSDINARDNNGSTALIRACRDGEIEEAEKLLKNPDININIPNEEGNTALIYASCRGHEKLVEQLLQHPDIDVNAHDSGNNRALDWAAYNGFAPVVKLLINHPDIDVNAQDNLGDTALTNAARNGHVDVVREILKHPDVDVQLQNLAGENALSFKKPKIVQMIKDYVPGVDRREGARVNNEVNLESVSNVNAQDKNGLTALMLASRRNQKEKVAKLLKNPDIDVNIKCYIGNTALIWATDNHAVNTIEELLQHPDTDVNIKGARGATALIRTSLAGDEEIAGKLLAHPDIDVNIRDEFGRTALSYAYDYGYKNVVEKILEHPDVDVSRFKNLDPEEDPIDKMIADYVPGVDRRKGVKTAAKPKQIDVEKLTSFKEIWTDEEKQNIAKMVENKNYNGLVTVFESKGTELNGRYEQLINDIDSVKEAAEKSARETETEKIREEEKIAAEKKVADKMAELDKSKAEYEEKNKALDNLINDYQSMLADDVEAAKSGFRALYGVKPETFPEKMGFGEQLVCVVEILNKNKNKLTYFRDDSPEKITKTLQDNNGQISDEGLKFMDRMLQVGDRTCSESDIISSINAVKDEDGHIDMNKAAYFIAKFAWGGEVSDIIQKVHQYDSKNN